MRVPDFFPSCTETNSAVKKMLTGELVFEDSTDAVPTNSKEAEKLKHDTFKTYFQPQVRHFSLERESACLTIEAQEVRELLLVGAGEVFDDKGGIKRPFVESVAGKNGSKVSITPRFQEDFPEERVERVMATQDLAQAVHNNLSCKENIMLRKLIPSSETVIAELTTVGFIGFPNSGEELAGSGSVLLTDKNIYFLWSNYKWEAAAEETLKGTTWCSYPCVGCCGCFQCCRMYSGSYSHLGVREAEDKVSSVPVSYLTPGGVKCERSDRLKVLRSVNMSKECKCCCDCCCCDCCCICRYCWIWCLSCCSKCIYHGQMSFKFSTDQLNGSSIESKIINNIKNKSHNEKIYDGRFRVLSIKFFDVSTNQVLTNSTT